VSVIYLVFSQGGDFEVSVSDGAGVVDGRDQFVGGDLFVVAVSELYSSTCGGPAGWSCRT
jgi:hypothetical protein